MNLLCTLELAPQCFRIDKRGVRVGSGHSSYLRAGRTDLFGLQSKTQPIYKSIDGYNSTSIFSKLTDLLPKQKGYQFNWYTVYRYIYISIDIYALYIYI